MTIGGFLRDIGAKRRKPAQSGGAVASGLAGVPAWGSLGDAGRQPESRRVATYLFRTPSCCGQVRAHRAGLPALFFGDFPLSGRRSRADARQAGDREIDLFRGSANTGRRENHKKGRAVCGCSSSWSCRCCLRHWRDVSKTTANARLLAPLSAPWRLTRWTGTSRPAPRSAQPVARFATTRVFATDLNTLRRLAPAAQLSDEAIGAVRPGGLSFVSGRADARRPSTGRDWNVQ